jgi:hypothetical protein
MFERAGRKSSEAALGQNRTGQNRTYPGYLGMSALTSEADIRSVTFDVRYVPQAAIRPLRRELVLLESSSTRPWQQPQL